MLPLSNKCHPCYLSCFGPKYVILPGTPRGGWGEGMRVTVRVKVSVKARVRSRVGLKAMLANK